MNLNSLHTFAHNTKEEWLTAIKKELGQKTLESLDWTPDPGIAMSPYYTSNPERTADQPGVFPFVIHQTVSDMDAATANSRALTCLAGGAQGIGFEGLNTSAQLDKWLENMEWPYIQIYLNHWPLTKTHHAILLKYAQSRGWQSTTLRGCLGQDASILWTEKLDGEAVQAYRLDFSACRLFVIDGMAMADSGATAIQQIAGILSVAQETLHRLVEAGHTIDEASAMIQINARVGTSYFMEMTKLNVIRALYANLVSAYHPQFECTKCIFIHAATGGRSYAKTDTNNNLLRATTSAMSAALGQATSIEVVPHDNDIPIDDAQRWARNTMHLLREESYFDQALRATQGSFYIEDMHRQMAESAWTLFVEMEEKGGWLKSESAWKAAAKNQQEAEQLAIANGDKIRVGVNKYQAK